MSGAVHLSEIPDYIDGTKKLMQESDYQEIVKSTQRLMVALERKTGIRMPLYARRRLVWKLLVLGRGGSIKVPKAKIIFILARYAPRVLAAHFQKQLFALVYRWFVNVFYVPLVRRRLEALGVLEARSK